MEKLGNSQYTVGNSQVVWRNWGIPSMLLGIPKLCGEIGEFPHTGNSRVVWRNWGIPNNILGIPKFCEAFWEFPVHDREFPLTSALDLRGMESDEIYQIEQWSSVFPATLLAVFKYEEMEMATLNELSLYERVLGIPLGEE
ncbi:hypothetical protein K435DRAFT_805072 [Dendrothele bispora CBS 962.96]|uniref:Uncharacterized protein n=1 Tax=Dendrothele bispora (strain CBS 962.96) TaxID=1314807 RepID=A0A4S8LC76_DENBC|nr:hypothetical protein K435DRAFT_805072 [Dendrothele bispora CBS 962.96]